VATGKEIRVLHGHEREVGSVAFSPDERTLATGSGDHTARLWEVATGKEIRVLHGHEREVGSVAFSPDGRTLATGSGDGTARLWEMATGKEQETDVLRGHTVAFSPDGRTLATGSADGTARMWEMATGKPIGVLRDHEGQVMSIAFSPPDGGTLAIGSSDNTVRMWEMATGKEIRVLHGHDREVESVAFSPDGRTLATGSGDNTARLWEVATGKEIRVLRGHDREVKSVAFNPDGRTLATGSYDKTARLWEVATGKPIGVLHDHERFVTSVAFSPDGRTLATGSVNYTMRLGETARLWEMGQDLANLACARVHFLPLSENDRQRFEPKEWCTPEVSAVLRAELRLDELDWAMTQNNLGIVLATLGVRESGTKRLEEAVEAYRAALQERTRERVPLQWAATQNNLGSALWMLGERESGTKRLEEAAASFSNVLQVDPDDERAYASANFLYHEKLFAFAEAFDLNQAWLGRHPDDLGAQAHFAEAAFTFGRFAKAEELLAALVDRPELNPGAVVALRALEICSLVALDRPDTLRAKLNALRDLLEGTRYELAADWTFAGSQHFIGEHPELSQHPWLIRLLAAIEERNEADAHAAVGIEQAASAAAQ
jgi:tetratricopeptide (TPR) repeat protein